MNLVVKYRFPQIFYLGVAISALRAEYDKLKEGDSTRVEISKAIQDLTQQLGFQQALGINGVD
jgi:hypothetical protein